MFAWMQIIMVRGAQILLLPLIVGAWIEAAVFDAERWFSACAELLSIAPGWPGNLLRKGFYGATLRGCAVRVSIAFGTLIVHRDAAVGHGVSIGSYCIIGRADIGDGAQIASRVSVTSGRHQHGSAAACVDPTTPRLERVAIGVQAWIGEGAIVMADIGRASIVGAGSVVTRAVADGVTVAGNPARELVSGAAAPLR
jgi:virginiamycin A acetyltransferase